MSKLKENARKVATATVSNIVMPAHLTIIVGGELVNATTQIIGKKLASAEGYLVSKIDPSRDSKEVASLREETTNNSIDIACAYIESKNRDIMDYLSTTKLTLKKAVVEVEHSVGLTTKEERDETKLLFHRNHLREQLELVRNDQSLSETERKKEEFVLKMAIGKINKQLKEIPAATPEQAFDLTPTS